MWSKLVLATCVRVCNSILAALMEFKTNIVVCTAVF